MLDEVRENLAFLENEWETERHKIEQKFLTGAVIQKRGKLN
jgi:hypothetical protein